MAGNDKVTANDTYNPYVDTHTPTHTFESQCFSFLKPFKVNIFENLPNLILHIFVKI